MQSELLPAPIWPDFMLPFMRWMAVNQIADLLALVGVLGVFFTFVKALQSQRAAEAARQASIATRNSIGYVAVISDFATGIAILEEIKRFHASKVISPLLLDRYQALRKILITARISCLEPAKEARLTDVQLTTLQGAIANLAKSQEAVERAIAGKESPEFTRLNKGLSRDLDNLHEILVHLKSSAGGPA